MNLFYPLISIQAYAATTAFVMGALIVGTVFFLIFTSSKEEDKTTAKGRVYKLRGKYFLVLVLAIIVGLIASFRFLPYEQFQNEPDGTVTVVAMQWAWKMAPGISDKKPSEFAAPNEITLPANKHIRFIVTSADVNHSFGIYNPDGLLIAQTQAMPQYKNQLEHQFTEKGDYTIICLEYCGMPHGYMVGTIHVN